MRVRIAFTKGSFAAFTPRGKAVAFYTRGFIRRNGKTITGTAYNSGPELVFYPQADGVNHNAAYDRKEEVAA